ncbi:hypothetical protein JB92DRAFT_2910889 [Gautieria morchelliformis]|nr:hypothetical protein JB92DRAFT_2910889 [Gautieria morchelliformis]
MRVTQQRVRDHMQPARARKSVRRLSQRPGRNSPCVRTYTLKQRRSPHAEKGLERVVKGHRRLARPPQQENY